MDSLQALIVGNMNAKTAESMLRSLQAEGPPQRHPSWRTLLPMRTAMQ